MKAVFHFEQKKIVLPVSGHADKPFRAGRQLFTGVDGVVKRICQDDADIDVPYFKKKKTFLSSSEMEI